MYKKNQGNLKQTKILIKIFSKILKENQIFGSASSVVLAQQVAKVEDGLL
jgi:hypothetical protein